MTVRVWAYGRHQNLDINPTTVRLNNSCYVAYPSTFDKFQIVLHYTAGENNAATGVGGWNGRGDAGAHFVVERQEHHPDAALANVVQVADDLRRATRHSSLTRNSIGIEISNLGVYQDAEGRPIRSESNLPSEVRADRNSYMRLRRRLGLCYPWCYAAYQEKQYRALVLLLRWLCVEFGIRRLFSGCDAETNLRHYSPDTPLRRFHGIFSHCNIAPAKPCGGPALNRNRLYRGLTEEWWMPVDLDAAPRIYYTAPFSDGQDLVRYEGRQWVLTQLADADVEGLQDTRSYYHMGSREAYCNNNEATRQGTFPIGDNRCWHGGVHLFPPANHARVYAAASGTIVAARMGRHQEIEQTLGSPRFVLIRHAVFLETAASGGSTRINYGARPVIVFSLYMHLAPLAQPGRDHEENAEWYNSYVRTGGRASVDQVFSPGVEVMVGDYLGDCDQWYDHDHCLHFEIISAQDIRRPPWSRNALVDDSRYWPSAQGPGATFACNQAQGRFMEMRDYACRHPSEWALTEELFNEALESEELRRELWPLVQDIGWYHRARRVSPDAAEHLPANGCVVHYHPITFMHRINSLLQAQDDYAGEARPAGTAGTAGETDEERNQARRTSESEGYDTLSISYRFSI
jgi:N-acetyl-anhydromuramyl-L-alanine amidase AmpD